jgi:hypothetical protein
MSRRARRRPASAVEPRDLAGIGIELHDPQGVEFPVINQFLPASVDGLQAGLHCDVRRRDVALKVIKVGRVVSRPSGGN